MRHFMLKIIFRSNFFFWRLNINHYFYNTKNRNRSKELLLFPSCRFISFQPLNVERLFDFQISLYIDCTHLGKLTKLMMMMMIINELTRQQNWQKCYCWIECFFINSCKKFNLNLKQSLLTQRAINRFCWCWCWWWWWQQSSSGIFSLWIFFYFISFFFIYWGWW